jgi:UDP-glucose 4-epimerase
VSVYLVTGGAGFIGSHIAEALLGRGHRVRVLDNFSTGRTGNLSFGKAAGALTVIEGDVRDARAVTEAVRGVDAVFHEAALPSVQRSVDDPATSHAVNVEGTVTVLEAARTLGVPRFVYAGSSSAYGESPTLPKKEEMAPAPLSPYAVSKLVGEYYCQVYARLYGMHTVSLRYFNVFGPRQDPASPYAAVIPLFIEAILDARAPTIYGDGGQTRDFTYIENVVTANLRALDAPALGGEVLNVATGERVSLMDVLSMLGKILGRAVVPELAPPRAGDVRHSLADITRAREVLGYAPTVSLEEGLRLTAAHMRTERGKEAAR